MMLLHENEGSLRLMKGSRVMFVGSVGKNYYMYVRSLPGRYGASLRYYSCLYCKIWIYLPVLAEGGVTEDQMP